MKNCKDCGIEMPKNSIRINLINKKPLFWPVIKLFFSSIDWETTIISFGRNVYSKYELNRELQVHEETHLLRQEFSYFKATIWWIKYILNKEFRLNEEVIAYQDEMQWIKKNKNNETAHSYRVKLAKDISGSLYNNLITFSEAMDLLK